MSKSNKARTKAPKKNMTRFKPKPHGIKVIDGDEPKTKAKTATAANTKAASKVPALVEGEVGKSAKLKLVTRRGRTSRFAAVIEKMRTLKEGEHVLIPCPKGKDGLPNTRPVNNMLWVMRRRSGVTPPKGCVFQSRTTEDGNLAVLCVKEKDKNKV